MPIGNVEQIILRIVGDSKSGEQALNKMQKRLREFGAALTAVSDAALVAFYKLGQGGAQIELLEEKFRNAAHAFGQSADMLLDAWQKASQGAITRAELMKKANYLMLTGIPITEVEWMLQAVTNASAATGRSIEDLFDRLALGLARSSKLLLDDLGIIIDVEQAKLSYAKTTGKAADALTEYDKKLAFTAAAREAAARQEQVLGKATESSATIIQRAGTALKDAGDEVKKAFVPVARTAAKVIVFLANAFRSIPQPVKVMLANLLGLLAVVGAVVGPLMTLIGLLPLIKVALSAISGVLPAVLPILVAVGAIAAAIALLAKAWRENWGGIQDTVQQVINRIRPWIDSIIRNVVGWINMIKVELRAIASAIRGIVEPILLRIRDLIGDGLGISEFMKTLRDATSVVLSIVYSILQSIRLLLEGKADQAWNPLKEAALNVITIIVIAWRKHIRKAVVWGWNFVVQLANGIIEAGRTVLAQAATFIGNILGQFFAPGSPPKKGPLSNIVKWGKGLIDTFLRAFGLADFGILRDTLSPIQAALQSAVDLGEIDQATSIRVFREVRQEAAQLIAQFRETGQISEEILDSIAAKLGEGGEEYAEYIRRTLEHQKALDRLRDVEQRVAEAREAGFIPQALKDELAAAEADVDAKKEAVDWQREYLDALREGADLQRELVETMKELTETMEKLGKQGKGGVLEGWPDLAGLQAAAGQKVEFKGFAGFSAEFEKVKEEVRVWFETLPERVKGWLAQIKSGASLWWVSVIAQLRLNLLMIGAILATRFLEMRERVRQTLLMIAGILAAKFLEMREKVRRTLLMIAAILAGQALIVIGKIRTTLLQIWFIVLAKLTEIYDAITGKIEEIVTWLGEKVLDFTQAGRDLIGGFMSGLAEKWEDLKRWFRGKFSDIPDWAKKIFGIGSPSRVFADIGKMAVKGLEIGLDLSNLERRLTLALGNLVSPGVAGAATVTGERIVVIQIGDMSLPGIRDGRDAGSLVEQLLQESADAAALRGTVPGGLMS